MKSFSRNPHLMNKPAFCGRTGERTLFIVRNFIGPHFSAFSSFAEAEVVAMIGATLRVLNVKPQYQRENDGDPFHTADIVELEMIKPKLTPDNARRQFVAKSNANHSQHDSMVASASALALIPPESLAECERIHGEIEVFFAREHRGNMTRKNVDVTTEFTVVEGRYYEQFLKSQVDLYLKTRIMSDEARNKLVSDLKEMTFRDYRLDDFYKISADEQVGGNTTSFESFVFRAQRCDNGNIAICTAYYREAITVRIVKHQDTEKVKRWLD